MPSAVETPTRETREIACPIPRLTREKLDRLSVSVRKQAKKLPDKAPIFYLGKNHVPFLPYSYFVEAFEKGEAMSLNPEEYFDYLTVLIETPEDIYEVIKAQKYVTDRWDRLQEASETLTQGTGDCDNLSWLAKRLFDALDCKKGPNEPLYDAKVIGIDDHAVCVYRKPEGGLASIDQQHHLKEPSTIYKTSTQFVDKDPQVYKPRETIPVRPGVRVLYEVDPENLEINYAHLEVDIDKEYSEENLGEDLPADWKTYRSTEVHFKVGNISYKSGRLLQKKTSDGSTFIYRNEGLVEKNLPDGRIEFYGPDGLVTQIEYPKDHGFVYAYEWLNEAGEVYQRETWDGIKEWLREDGSLHQRSYPPEHSLFAYIEQEFFYPDGKRVKQRNFRPLAVNRPKYHIEWYTEDTPPQLYQIAMWDNRRALIEG